MTDPTNSEREKMSDKPLTATEIMARTKALEEQYPSFNWKMDRIISLLETAIRENQNDQE